MKPKVGEYVLVKITKVLPYGAFAELLDYPGIKGFIHISEIASFWVKNIRSHVKEGQIRVAKVMKVDERAVNLSLRRVSKGMRKRILEDLKRRKKAQALIEKAAKELGADPGEIISRLEEKYDNPYDALEEAVLSGPQALPLPKEWREVVYRVAKDNIEIPVRVVKGELVVRVPGPRGVEVIREALSVEDAEVYTVGAPRYMMEVKAPDYKEAERKFREIAEKIGQKIRKAGGEFEYRILD